MATRAPPANAPAEPARLQASRAARALALRAAEYLRDNFADRRRATRLDAG